MSSATTNNKEKQKKISGRYILIIAGMLVLTALLAITAYILMRAYEKSMLSIYADQQDAYVQIVLDQINVQPEKTDKEIISNILSSLDTSSEKYWTLSKDQTLLFVKDVLETNRYKGFQTPTFYSSDSASEFIKEMQVNHVKHKTIEMDGDQYVVSGVIFEYNNAQYRICLLTNETIILNNNTFLSAKIGLYIFLGLLILALLVGTMILAYMVDTRRRRIIDLLKKIERQNLEMGTLEEKLAELDSYHPRTNLFNRNLMDQFIKKLEERQVIPIAFMKLKFYGPKGREAFLEWAQFYLDEPVIRFAYKRDSLVLMFVQYRLKEAKKAIQQFEQKYIMEIQEASYEHDNTTLWEAYRAFINKIGKDDEDSDE